MDEATVAAWISRYVHAWESNDPAAIGDLFAEDAAYFPRPDGEPWRGRDRIVAGWLERKDEPGSWSFRSEVLATVDDLAFVRGGTHYVEPPDRFQQPVGDPLRCGGSLRRVHRVVDGAGITISTQRSIHDSVTDGRAGCHPSRLPGSHTGA